MSKQIFVAFTPRIGQAAGTDALLLERVHKALFDTAGPNSPAAGLFGSPLGGVKAVIDDGDVSQDAANAIAQGVFNAVGVGRTYKATEVDSVGGITELTAPIPE
jgi:hypothetical protein